MVARRSTQKVRTPLAARTAAVARAKEARAAPVFAVTPEAEARLRVVGRAALRFGRRSMHEVNVAAIAARTPMIEIWRRLHHAGRAIAREASLAWRTVRSAGPMEPKRRGHAA
jgi:hypothetical protein